MLQGRCRPAPALSVGALAEREQVRLCKAHHVIARLDEAACSRQLTLNSRQPISKIAHDEEMLAALGVRPGRIRAPGRCDRGMSFCARPLLRCVTAVTRFPEIEMLL